MGNDKLQTPGDDSFPGSIVAQPQVIKLASEDAALPETIGFYHVDAPEAVPMGEKDDV
jgi:hypothetical protein